MDYKVLVTSDAEADLENFISYLIYEKQSVQAAKNVLDDFDETKDKLAKVASALPYCDNPKLKALGYRRMNFTRHKYFMLYRIVGDRVYIDNIFHHLQDYENCI